MGRWLSFRGLRPLVRGTSGHRSGYQRSPVVPGRNSDHCYISLTFCSWPPRPGTAGVPAQAAYPWPCMCHRGSYRPARPGRYPACHRHEAAVIREAARRVLAGEAVRVVARDLNTRGIITVAGKAWTTDSLTRVLIAARISGRREYIPIETYNGATRPKTGEITAENTWPAIITPAQSGRLRALLTAPGRGHTNGHAARTYLLSGVFRCGLCGHPMYGRVHNGKPRYQCIKDPGRPGLWQGRGVRAPGRRRDPRQDPHRAGRLTRAAARPDPPPPGRREHRRQRRRRRQAAPDRRPPRRAGRRLGRRGESAARNGPPPSECSTPAPSSTPAAWPAPCGQAHQETAHSPPGGPPIHPSAPGHEGKRRPAGHSSPYSAGTLRARLCTRPAPPSRPDSAARHG
jgi:Recombinase/Recombinase zinc beta ribbon domain